MNEVLEEKNIDFSEVNVGYNVFMEEEVVKSGVEKVQSLPIPISSVKRLY